MAEIINNVAEILFWDIFLMGLFTLLLLTAGAMWAGTSGKEFVSKTATLIKQAKSLDKPQAVASLVVALIVIYYTGVMFNTFSDDWIDQKGAYHLYLKSTWLKRDYEIERVGTDNTIKIRIFERIYDVPPQEPGRIIDFYYYAKNKLWKDESWKKYILYSQTMINIARVWCLTFFLLFLLALARLPIRFVLSVREVSKTTSGSDVGKTGLAYKLGPDVVLSLLVILITLIGYWAGGIVWQSSEEEIDSKIFGVYRSEFGVSPRIVEEIEGRNLGYRVTELVAPARPLEASGVAAFDDHLFIVSDKDNDLYVADPEAPVQELTVIEVPGFPDEKTKFEDISFHRESGFFYVIGAHYSSEPNYQKTFRFKLQREGGSWRPIEVKALSISAEILSHLSDTARVEGIAVAGDANDPTLFIGIRSDRPGQFPILEFSWNRSGFTLRSSYELQLSPERSSGNFSYHLSGLAAVSDSELLVLATSEDEANGFHGNRVYTVALHERVQRSVTPEFALAQKAEGIAVWTASESQQRVAIVFDNDRKDTGQPSRLLIAKSLGALRN